MFIKKYSLIAFICLSVCTSGFGSDAQASKKPYRKAEMQDLSAVVRLINEKAIHDSDKIVVVPEDFREDYFKKVIENERLFVAEREGNIAGLAKLFCIIKEAEKENILREELQFDSVDNQTLYIYRGGEYTDFAYRGEGINKGLIEFALEQQLPMMKDLISKNKYNRIALVYGVTESNMSRIPKIDKDFSIFMQHHMNALPDTLDTRQFNARKPSFDPKSKECVPLPYKEWEPGRGCYVAIGLSENKELPKNMD